MVRSIMYAVTCIVLQRLAPMATAAEDATLAGHWKLAASARDSSSHGNHAKMHHGVDLTASGPNGAARTAAAFDGLDHFLEVPHAASLELSRSDFTIAAWLYTDPSLDDVLGDVVSKYDPKTRTGFQLSLLCNPGVTTHQPNYRHVAFGIDAGTPAGKWIDCGRPGSAVLVFALCVHHGHLYAGTCEPEADEAGHVYRYQDGNRWADCGAPDGANSVSSLAVYRGRLYAGTAKYRLRGSALTESNNPHAGGRVYQFQGGTSWKDCGRIGPAEAVNGLVVFDNRLYASAMYQPGLFRYEGGQNWMSCGSPDGKRVESLGIHDGHLYATGYDEGAVYRYDGPRMWTHLGRVGESTQTYGLATYNGQLHASTWPGGKVFAYGEGQRWIDKGRLADELEVMALAVYNGQLYAGTLPSAGVFRYAGALQWEVTDYLDTTPDVRYRRAWSMAVFDGRLFCGTLPSGHVLSMEVGKNVTYDTALKAGWRHVAAARDGRYLKLYIDGRLVARSTEFEPEDYNVTTTQPLWIGRGTTDVLNGRLSDVRLYRRALTADQVVLLYRASDVSDDP